MSVQYKAVGWNRQKKRYDAILLGGIVAYLATFIGGGALLFPNVTAETLMLRGLGTAAFVLLHVILAIGPLARLAPRFLPLLYNRRHMGVTMCILGTAHAVLATIQYHVLGVDSPLRNAVLSNTNVLNIHNFPFQWLGIFALMIFILMAVTSHDFWMANLTAPVWKALHMGVYLAYGSLVLHVSLGFLQSEQHPGLIAVVGAGFFTIVGLHLVSAIRERRTDTLASLEKNGYVKAVSVEDIKENCAKIVTVSGERVAIFKYDGKLSAVSNVCQHQNGPLGEGKIIDGCITCPWHGYQYEPHNGSSPAPFNEKIPTFPLKLVGNEVWVKKVPNPAGTPEEPVVIAKGSS